MAKADTVKSLLAGMVHLRNCTIRPAESCKDCMQGMVIQCAALSESVEIADIMRIELQKVQARMAGQPQ